MLRTSQKNAPIIEARDLSKKYGELMAVDSISFHVNQGECVGFLGPNGAGKTTTIQMVCGLTPITKGDIQVGGLNVQTQPREVKSILGVCPQQDNLDPDFNVRRNLEMYALFFGLTKRDVAGRIDELLEFFKLTEKTTAKIDELSGGMKRRLVLARALLNQPKILILDEPTTGLDPQVRQLIWQRVRNLKEEGLTVLLTTHYMEEATQLCDRVVLMNSGRILLEGKPAELIQNEIGKEVVEIWNVYKDVRTFLATQDWRRDEVEGRIFIYDVRDGEVAAEISKAFPHQERLIRKASLEDVFLKYSGRTLGQ